MLDIIKKSVYTGLGMALMTKEKVEEAAKKIAAESKLSLEESEKLAKELMEKSVDAKKGLEKKIEETTLSVHNRLNAPTIKKIEALENRIKELEKEQKK